MNKKSRISLKDIAQELGLSISTVSRVLRNTGDISDETRNKVLNLAEKWGYRPNPLALALLNNKTKMIGVVLPDIESYYYACILKGMEKVAFEKGYRLMTMYSNDDYMIEKRAIEDLAFSRVDGIIACPALETADYKHYYDLISEDFPLIHVHRDCEGIQNTRIITDNFNSAYALTKHLLDAHCRNIALITSLEPLSEGIKRLEGYRAALDDHDIKFNSSLIVHGNLNVSTSIEATRNLLKLDPLPDAIIGNNDVVAMAAMKVVKESGYKIPGDIMIAGYTDDPFSSFLEPSLTTISQPSWLMGMKAMELIISMINGEMPINEPKKIVFDSALVERGSTKL